MSRALIASLAAFVLSACSPVPRMRPADARQEPVFHETDYATLGADHLFHWGEPDRNSLHGEKGFTYWPVVAWGLNMSPWVNLNLLPLMATVLLTGDQYGEDGMLEAERVHLSAHGGIVGVSYDDRDGWLFPAEAGLDAKILAGDRVWGEGRLAVRTTSTDRLRERQWHSALGFGWQAGPRAALYLRYAGILIDMPAGYQGSLNGLGLADGDRLGQLTHGVDVYLTPRHIFRFEILGGIRNERISGRYYAALNMGYRFVF